MAFNFLELNGWQIPVSDDGASKNFEIIGDRTRAFSGRMRSTRRAIKRRFAGALKRKDRSFAEAFQSVILGLGELWPFNYEDAANLTEDFFSTKGLGVVAGTNAAITFGIAADGAIVKNREGFTESKFGSGSMTTPFSVDNILPADVRDVEGAGTAGFSAVGTAALALDTTNVLQGTQSLKVTLNANGDGFETDPVPASAALNYNAVVYVKPTFDPETEVIAFTLEDDDTGIIGVADSDGFDSTTDGDWVKLVLTGTTGAAATEIKIKAVAPSAALVFYVDALQIDQGNADHAIWADGIRSGGEVSYSPSFLTGEDITINAWARADAPVTGGDRVIVLLSKIPGPTGQICLERLSGGTLVRFRTEDEFGVADGIQSASSLWDGDWKMITAVIRNNPGTGEFAKELYVGGVRVDQSSPAGLPDISLLTNLDIGHADSSQQWFREQRGLLDDVAIYPYAAHADQIAGWLSLGEALGALPRIKASGDFVGDTQVIVEGELGGSSYRAFTDSAGVHHNAGQEVNFTLHEV